MRHNVWRTCMLLFALVAALFCGPAPRSAHAESTSDLPERFDLRERGVVSPVKNQLPWGTCWSLATMAASESSVLSELGTTYSEYPLEFSSRHLAWFAGTKLPDAETMASLPSQASFASQAQEGTTVRSNTENPFAHPLESGGFAIEAASLFACGIGPVTTNDVPYKNDENMATCAYCEEDDLARLEEGQTLEEFLQQNPGEHHIFAQITGVETDSTTGETYINTTTPRQGCVEVTQNLIDGGLLSGYAVAPVFDDKGYFIPAESFSTSTPLFTWGVAEEKRFNCAYELEECHVLPLPTSGYVNQEYRYNPAATEAIKQELLAGRGVVIGIYEDNVDETRGYARFTNPNTWSQYTTSEDGKVYGSSHEVCIVGWDDSWDQSKFSHGAAATPPGPGAWIIKNSYGSEDQAFPNNGKSGYVDEETGLHTGYFYLSYYDMSIANPTSFNFDVSGHISDTIYQYDFVPACQMHIEKFNDKAACANVFKATADQVVRTVSVEAQYPNTHVRLELWKLGDDAASPTDGELAGTAEADLAYEGYYRLPIGEPCYLSAGQRFAVVAYLTTSDADGNTTYQVPMHRDVNEAGIQKWGDAVTTYVTAVVNEGESFLLRGETWSDWATEVAQGKQSGWLEPAYDYDNFALKAYADAAEPAPEQPEQPEPSEQNPTPTQPTNPSQDPPAQGSATQASATQGSTARGSEQQTTTGQTARTTGTTAAGTTLANTADASSGFIAFVSLALGVTLIALGNGAKNKLMFRT